MAAEPKGGKTVGVQPDDMVYDITDASPMDFDPEADAKYLRDSEEFFRRENPQYHALLKRVQRGATSKTEKEDGGRE